MAISRVQDLINNIMVSAHQRSAALFPAIDGSANLAHVRLSVLPVSLSSVVVNPWEGTDIDSLVFNFSAVAGDRVSNIRMTAGAMYKAAHQLCVATAVTPALEWNRIQFDAARWLGYAFKHACAERARLGSYDVIGIPEGVVEGFQKNRVPQQLLRDYMDGRPDLRMAA